MTLLILGLALWTAGHVFKRVLPGVRETMGNAGKGVAAVLILAGVLAMIFGYKAAEFVPVWQPPAFMVHINNLLMLGAVFLFGLGSSKSPLRAKMRHPMLTGMVVWAVAHLLVNGDLASLVLFGGLAIWALAEMRIINASEPVYHRFEGGSLGGTVRLLVITVVVFAVIGGIHTWLGYRPFPG
ncbi:NnrU family protein [Ovoidimarina sediminis]|uniref:NnrU family protein n=1 Tax=Ovoidimarina sediminis TaxID=3079856 RepID=UPI002906AD8A|nr:NnrU family protein [Rhodophyticola sp. MJ-SS7]MDU8944598.1 NnrU family protein [Rhodophyticola sp. MJ-SS7]